MEARLIIGRADMGFSAAHFAVHDGRSERLHGHNYRVFLEASGAVGTEGTVVDFSVLKSALRSVCAELDERLIVPTRSARVAVQVGADQVELLEGQRRYLVPAADTALLPIANSTCEAIATHLLEEVRRRLGEVPVRLALRVEELPGQGAVVGEG